MKVYKKNLPEGVKKKFTRIKGVKVKLVAKPKPTKTKKAK